MHAIIKIISNNNLFICHDVTNACKFPNIWRINKKLSWIKTKFRLFSFNVTPGTILTPKVAY